MNRQCFSLEVLCWLVYMARTGSYFMFCVLQHATTSTQQVEPE